MAKIWIILILFLVVTITSAQSIKYGLIGEGGPSWSTYDGFTNDNRSFGFSTGVGFWINKHIGSRTGLEIDVLWFRHNDKLVRKDVPLVGSMGELWGVISSTSTLTSNYISVPLLFNYKISKWLQLSIGPQTSIFVNGVDKYKATGSMNQVSLDEKSKTKFKGNTLIDFGPRIGVEFLVGNGLRINVNHYRGVQNVSKSNLNHIFERRNRNISLGVKYALSNGENSKSVEL